MNRRLAIALLVFSCAASAGLASSSGHDAGPKAEQPAPYSPRVPQVLLPTLVSPVVVNGELHHYVFLSIALDLTAAAHKKPMLEKIPYFQDAFLREVHRASIAKENDPAMLDDVGLKERLLRVAVVVAGDGVVQAVELRAVGQIVR